MQGSSSLMEMLDGFIKRYLGIFFLFPLTLLPASDNLNLVDNDYYKGISRKKEDGNE